MNIKKSQLEELVVLITKSLLNEMKTISESMTVYKTREGGSDVYWIDNKDTGGKQRINPEKLNWYRAKGYSIIDINSGEDLTEESSTSSVSPANGKLPIVKKVMEDEENRIRGKFIERGEIKLDGGINQTLADKIAHYHWDIMQSMGKDERGVFNYKTRGDRWCCSVGLLNGQPAMLSITTTPGRLQLLTGNSEIFNEETLEEISDCGGAGAYNIPAAFSRRDGASSKALDGSKSLGYELTPQGKKDFERHPDAMI